MDGDVSAQRGGSSLPRVQRNVWVFNARSVLQSKVLNKHCLQFLWKGLLSPPSAPSPPHLSVMVIKHGNGRLVVSSAVYESRQKKKRETEWPDTANRSGGLWTVKGGRVLCGIMSAFNGVQPHTNTQTQHHSKGTSSVATRVPLDYNNVCECYNHAFQYRETDTLHVAVNEHL